MAPPPPPGDSSLSPIDSDRGMRVDTPPDDIPSLSQGSSAYQDAQCPFSPTDDEASPPPSPRAPPSKIQMAMAMDAFQDVPLDSLTPEEVVDFTHKTIRSTHPTEVRHLSPPHLASLRCTITQFDHSVSEMTERLEDSQQSHTDTLQEVAMAESLQQAANLAALECSVNHQTSILRADISRLAITSDNIQRTQADVTARLHPQSRVMHQLQKTASGLSDSHSTFPHHMEYYMHRIGVQFEESPILQDLLKPVSGDKPPTPLHPGAWPKRSATDRDTITQLQDQITALEQELNLCTCDNSCLENTVVDLEEKNTTANRRIEDLHYQLGTLRKANSDLSKASSDAIQAQSKTSDDPSHLHKEAARMVADRQQAFDLAKKRHAKEMSQLREENRSLLQQLPQSSTQEADTTPHSLTYSGKLRSLTAQNEALQKRLKAATVTNTSLTDKLQQTRSSSTKLHAQVASLNQAMADMKLHYQREIEVMSSDKDKSLMEQRAEIETLHAEHDHAMAVMQAESKAHTDTITLLQHELATTKAQAILPSVAQGLRKDISAQFHTITDLNKELAATKDEAVDLMEALTQAKTAQTLSEQTSTKLRADIQSLTDQLETSQHDRQDAQNQTQALQAQIQQLMLPPPPLRCHHRW